MKATAFRALALLGILCGAAQAQQGAQPMHHRFGGAEHWAQVFDDPERDVWQKPDEVIRALGLAPDAAVADIGSGTGYFSVRLARALPAGRVYGADLEPDMVHYLGRRAMHENLANVVPVQAAPDDPRLPAPVDVVIVVDTYHHIGARPDYFSRLRRSLKPGARVAIIDYRADSPDGPPAAYRVPPSRVEAEMRSAGYRLLAAHDFLPRQYFLVFAPAPG